ncbi:MAG: efflux RND transporter permease subunit [Gemmatimonadaceae bacterium]|nr:efflux RND transporter permease subunit [Gemmatimonadaceae bacterium]MCC6432960.1 efflux RND transporter permease subunit [Gemmatimonadaceae bacterium]
MIRFAAHRPAVVWAACIALLIAGAIAFSRLPLATRTTVELPQLSVNAGWTGAAPEVIETYLTSPIEAAIQGVRGVKRVVSTSSDGSANLRVDLEPNADVQMTRLAILERLELLRSELPPGVSPPSVANYVPQGLEDPPLLSLTVFGPYTPGTLQKLLDERVKPRLSAVPGVASVSVQGGSDLGVAVTYDPVLLRRIGISPTLLSDALTNARIVQSLGVKREGSTERSVVLRDQPGALEDLEALPVRGPAGRVFRLGDLATVRAEEDARGRFFRIDGEPAVAIEVTRHAGADAIKTAAALRATIDAMRPGLPLGVRLRVGNDASVDLARELDDLTKRGAIAFAAVMVVLALLLRRWRAVALVMGSTAVAIAATALTLYVFDVPANLLTLAGLGMGVGILVQDALIVVNRLGSAPDTADGRAAATGRIMPAVVGSTLTTAVVLFPFLYLQGNARSAFAPFAAAFVFALGWSLFTALLMVPALGAKAMAGRARRSRAQRLYVKVLGRMLRWRAATLLVTVGVLAVLTWGFIKKVPRSSFSGFGERRTTLTVSLNFPRGSEPTSVDEAMREFESIVVGRPEVEQVRTLAYSGTQAQMQVLFTREGGLTAVPLEMQESLTQRAVLVGGASVGVYGDGPGFSSGGGGGSFASFRMNVQGYSYDGVARIAEDLKTRLERITRVREVRITSGSYFGGDRGSQVTLEPDRPSLARYGITAAQLAQSVSREIRGPVGRQLVEIGGDELPVTLKATGARERSLDELQDAIIPTGNGAPVRIGDVAWVDAREALGTIRREDQQYIRQVSYDFRGPTKLARRTHTAFMASLSAPAGYSIIDLTDGSPFDRDNSEQGLWLVFAVGITLVVLTVALVFDSVWGAAMVFLSLPLALSGVAAAFWAFKVAFTREAAVGVILVVGLAVHQSILLVDAALVRRRARRDAGSDLRLDAGMVLRAAVDRGGMIVLITLASLASLVPLSVGTEADSLFGAIALATAGGTVAGTVGAMFVMPLLLVGRRVKRSRRKPLPA